MISLTHFLVLLSTVRSLEVPNCEVAIADPIALPLEPVESPNILEVTSTLRKRKTKMNNHKRRKRLKKMRFLLRKLGKI